MIIFGKTQVGLPSQTPSTAGLPRFDAIVVGFAPPNLFSIA